MSAAWAAACGLLCVAATAAAQPAQPPVPAPTPAPPEAQPPETPPTPPAPAEPPPAETPPGGAPGDPAAPAPTTEPAAPVTEPEPPKPEPDPPDQAIGGALGIAAGGRLTPGGLRITGHYLYQLTEQDWFDGIASFTFGSGDPACFRDRGNDVLCDHGLASGGAFELAAGVRRIFPPSGRYRPFARVAAGIMIARFGGDEVTGAALTAHAGGGLRASVAPSVAVVALADVMLGLGAYGRGIGGDLLLGLSITAGAEIRLR